jgi:hypothetical protein
VAVNNAHLLVAAKCFLHVSQRMVCTCQDGESFRLHAVVTTVLQHRLRQLTSLQNMKHGAVSERAELAANWAAGTHLFHKTLTQAEVCQQEQDKGVLRILLKRLSQQQRSLTHVLQQTAPHCMERHVSSA